MSEYKKIPTANLDHHIPSESLLTASDYDQIPKSEEAQLHKKTNLEFRDFLPDDSGLSVWDRLRKPEFQRQTNSWTDEKYINLLKTLKENQVIPGVIFWLNTSTGHIFVLDGAHRLSAIRAWATNDWGDSAEAKDYGYLEEDEIMAAQRLREYIRQEIGSYDDSKKAGKKYRSIVDSKKNPKELLDDVTESLGHFAYHLNTSLNIPIQWVLGGYKDAEQSFVNINTGGTPLTSEEALFLQNRRSPVARAMSGIISNGSKSSVWITNSQECTILSKNIYDKVLSPSDNIEQKLKITDYPLVLLKRSNSFDRYQFLQYLFCISKYGQTSDLNISTTLAYLANEQNNSLVGQGTVEALERLDSMLNHFTGNQPQSLGLLPAFFFYTSKGQYRQTLFLLFTMWLTFGSKEEVILKKLKFTSVRSTFEETWMLIKDYMVKFFGKKGGPTRLSRNLVEIFDNLLIACENGIREKSTPFDIAVLFLSSIDNKLQTEFINEFNDDGQPFKNFSSSTKTRQTVLSYFQSCLKCEICGGSIDLDVSQQVDHKERKSSGGTNGYKNARIVHPFCNNHRDKLENLSVNKQQPINVKENIIPEIEPVPQLTYEQMTLF